MKRLFLCILFFLVVAAVFGQVRLDQSMIQLATQYYNARDFEKAAPLFKDIYKVSNNRYYFRLYISSLTELQRFQDAENEIRSEIKRDRNPQPDLLVHWGYILKLQKLDSQAKEKFEEAVRSTPANRSSYINTANMFIQWREFEWAERLYKQGKKLIVGENFHSELASVYLYLRNYDLMLEEMLQLVKQDEKHLTRVQSNLSSALYLDIENGLRDKFRSIILKHIQSEPGVLAYNRLFIWFLLQERQFTAALRQYIALDRRTGTEEQQILALARMALGSHNYNDASAAYDYVLSKGTDNPAWTQAYMYKLYADYQYFTTNKAEDNQYGWNLATSFETGLETLGFSTASIFLVRAYAHLLAFYLDDAAKAVDILNKGMEVQGLPAMESGEIKTEMADVYVYSGDPWEAILLYSQVAEANRNNSLGDEAKLKKAKLGYYMGNFSWAKAQLDVIKG
jgi:hypothetical protein